MAEFVESMVDSLLEENCPAEIPSDDWDFGTVDAWVESMTGEKGYDASEIECEQDPDVLAELREAYMDIEGTLEDRTEAFGGEFQGGSIDIVTSDDVAEWKRALEVVRGNNQ